DKEGEVVPWEGGGRTLQVGDRVAFHVENRSRVPIDVTLLFVDSGFGIEPFFPEAGQVEDNRFQPGQARTTPCRRVQDHTLGVDHMVVLALKAEGPPADFAWLPHPPLDRPPAPPTPPPPSP